MQLPPPYDRRFGRFRVGIDAMKEYPDRLAELLARCVVLRAETRFDLDAIEYTALCPSFKPVAPSCEAPLYNVVARFSPAETGIRCRQPWDFRFASVGISLEAWEHFV